ncbi:MAG: hypothetical protein KatS3mg131_2950 [Candidatus Tectimicrobiota bacterium]|nr:MAG: hypothetical protein KatS3mg131_2950 [Candidatus Tectomicrobia bacterium]
MPWRGAQQVAALGAGEILLTSMDRDGTQAGYDLALTRPRGRSRPDSCDRLGGGLARLPTSTKA